MTAATARRWFARVLLLVLSLGLVGWMVLTTQWGRDRVRDLAIRRVAMAVDGVLTIDRLEGSLWSDATLRGVRITKQGEVVLAVDRVSVDYNLRGLMAGDITLSRIDAEGVNATVEQNAKGWALRGLANCLAARGEKDEVAKVESDFKAAWSDADVEITASCFCARN